MKSREQEANELNAKVKAIYEGYRPALAQGFAEYVFKAGAHAVVPGEDGKQRFAGKTWQWVGRKFYGQLFVDALKKLIEAK